MDSGFQKMVVNFSTSRSLCFTHLNGYIYIYIYFLGGRGGGVIRLRLTLNGIRGTQKRRRTPALILYLIMYAGLKIF